MSSTRPSRPVLRYHGGKFRLAPWIVSHFPPHRVYVEPYCGAASVLLHKERCYAEVINDLSEDVDNLFRVLREPAMAKDLENLLRLTPFSRPEFERAFIICSEPVERARRLMARSFMGFGSDAGFMITHTRSTFRNNTKRACTIPAHDWARFPGAIQEFTKRLAGVVIERRDALKCIQQHDDSECLIYCDPPYVHETRLVSTKYAYKFEMTDDDHRALAAVLHSVKGMVVLSGYDCPLYADLYDGWHFTSRAAFADGARKRIECLWMNGAAYRARKQQVTLFEETA